MRNIKIGLGYICFVRLIIVLVYLGKRYVLVKLKFVIFFKLLKNDLGVLLLN